MKIEKGYYIKARCIQESAIAIAPPYIREIWDWLLKECNHKDNKSSGKIIKRGECLRTFKDIQDGLKWMVGYRKETYKKWQCENAMKWLTREQMITTAKTTRGMFITVVKYDKYQDPKNYENNNESNNGATMEQQLTDTINKNDKNVKNTLAETSSADILLKKDSTMLIQYFYDEYTKWEKNPPVITNWGKYNKKAQPYIKAYGLENMKKAVNKYLALGTDKFINDSNHSLDIFLSDNNLQKLKN